MLFHAETQRLKELAPEHTTPPAAPPERKPQFIIVSYFMRQAQRYAIGVPFGPGVLDLSQAEIDALPVVEMTARECRVFGLMLTDLAKSHDLTIERLKVDEAQQAEEVKPEPPVETANIVDGSIAEPAGVVTERTPEGGQAATVFAPAAVVGAGEPEADRMTDEGGADPSAEGGDR